MAVRPDMAAPPPDCVPCSLRLAACRNRLKRNFTETVIGNLDFALFAEPATDSCRRAATIRRNRHAMRGADKSVYAKSRQCDALRESNPPLPPWLAAPLRHAKKVRIAAGHLKRLASAGRDVSCRAARALREIVDNFCEVVFGAGRERSQPGALPQFDDPIVFDKVPSRRLCKSLHCGGFSRRRHLIDAGAQRLDFARCFHWSFVVIPRSTFDDRQQLLQI